jgi:Polysaccharide lyase
MYRSTMYAALLAVSLLASAGLAQANVSSLSVGVESQCLVIGGSCTTGFDETNAEDDGTLDWATGHVYAGSYSMRTDMSTSGSGLARGVLNTDGTGQGAGAWDGGIGAGAGDTVYWGAAIYLGSGFKQDNASQVDLMRWDTYGNDPDDPDRSGIAMYSSDDKGYLFRQTDCPVGAGSCADQTDLVGPFDLPVGEWLWIEVKQTLNDTANDGFNKVWVNGTAVDAGNDKKNTDDADPANIRYGLVSASANSTGALSLWTDRHKVATAYIGP